MSHEMHYRVIGGGPRLELAEWLALVQLHRIHGGAVLGPDHPDVVAASPALARLAQVRGDAREGAVLRSPAGLARRMSILRRMERGEMARAPREAVAAWHRFDEDPIGAAALAISVLRGGANEPDHFDRKGGDQESRDMVGGFASKPSRGPAPYVGVALVETRGGPQSVYLMVLDGILPETRDQYTRYVKVGRSRDVIRREEELNHGFPPGMGLRWRTYHELRCPTGEDAHRIEQALLGAIASAGGCIGGEFCIGAPDALREIVEHVATVDKGGGPLPSLTPPARRDARVGVQGRADG